MATEPYNPSPIGNPSVLARRNWWQTMLVKFIGKHTPKCNEMVRILSKSMDEPLPLTMRIKKRFHFLICCWCRRYEEQLHYLRGVSQSFPEHAGEAIPAPVSNDAKERWKNALRAAPAVCGTGFEPNVEFSSPEEISSQSRPVSRSAWAPWNIPLVAMAVLLLIFALRSLWMPPSSRPLTDFRSEMVNFIKAPPTLQQQSSQLSELNQWISKTRAPSGFVVPARVQEQPAVGCRVLRFEGRDVTLVCFRGGNASLVHLFVVDAAAVSGLPERQRAEIASEGEWMTAAWSDARYDYLLAVQGDEAAIKRLLGDQ